MRGFFICCLWKSKLLLLFYNIICLGLVHWNDTGMVGGGRREWDSGWGTHVHPWRIHVDVWQNQYNILKLLTPN